MKNIVFILSPEKAKVEINDGILCVSRNKTEITCPKVNNRDLKVLRKTSVPFSIHYIEDAKINGNEILSANKQDKESRSVIVLDQGPVKVIGQDGNSIKAGDLYGCLIPDCKDAAVFTMGKTMLAFNARTANAVFV